jgi:hypothetical protein
MPIRQLTVASGNGGLLAARSPISSTHSKAGRKEMIIRLPNLSIRFAPTEAFFPVHPTARQFQD